MTKSYNPNTQWATDDNYAAGIYLWSGAPTKIAPSAGIQTKGAVPNLQVSAQEFNWVLNNAQQSMLVQANAAMTRWSHCAVNGTTDAIGKRILPVSAASGGFNPATQQKAIALLGLKTSNSHALSAYSTDGLDFQSTTTDAGLASLFSCVEYDGFSVIFGILSGGTSGQYTADVTGGAGWASFTVTGMTVDANFCHYSGSRYLVASQGQIYSATSLGAAWTSSSYGSALDTVKQIVHDPGGAHVVLIRKQQSSSHYFAAYSTDAGATFTSVQDFGTQTVSLAYSEFYALFIALTSNGEMWTSPTGSVWTKIYSLIGGLTVFNRVSYDFACVGPVIATLVNRVGSIPYCKGIAYSTDLGATWRESYFGLGQAPQILLNLVAANGRLYASDNYNVYSSGSLEASDSLYSGTP